MTGVLFSGIILCELGHHQPQASELQHPDRVMIMYVRVRGSPLLGFVSTSPFTHILQGYLGDGVSGDYPVPDLEEHR